MRRIPKGHVNADLFSPALTRREAIRLMGVGAGAALAVGSGLLGCQGAAPRSLVVGASRGGAGPFAFVPAHEQARWVRSGEVSPVELVTECLERIERLDPQLHAYVTVVPEQALAEARRMESRVGDDAPPFLGLPTSIKDLTPTADIRTTYSSKVFADWIPEEDHPVVARMRRAGFIIVGKTNTPEFGTSFTESELNGICRNPWDLERTPSGSSGGAAVAVAAGLGSVAHGTDGAGSIRVPSSFCGVVGLKPSRGRVAFGPDFGNGVLDQSVHGPLARTVRDCAALLDVMVGHLAGEPYWGPSPERPFVEEAGLPSGRLRVALCTEFPMGPTEPECAGAAHAAAQLIESLGHDVEEATPDWVTILRHGGLRGPGFAARVDAEDAERLEPRNRALWYHSQQARLIDTHRALPSVRAARQKFLKFWDRYDLLLTPTCGIAPPPVGTVPWDASPQEHQAYFATFPNYAVPFNYSGQPAISLPLHWSDQGMPIGVQIVGRPFDEALLIRIAAELEQVRPWARRVPPMAT